MDSRGVFVDNAGDEICLGCIVHLDVAFEEAAFIYPISLLAGDYYLACKPDTADCVCTTLLHPGDIKLSIMQV